ncbi:MAG: glycerol-3-phosphate 1-O-acyltransferase PlsY [Bacteroidales bacterium]|nr:glycerol-3-phosphate 1-O-acyltransferase PlsY [Bacteroidales bacterium]
MFPEHTLIAILIYFLIAYLIGSIPNAVWIGKVFYGKDVRNEGSKNAGATNTFRVLGWKPGLCVLLLDLFKGMLPVMFFYRVFWVIDIDPDIGYMPLYYWLWDYGEIIVAIVTVLGHVFPIYVGFRGGKGVATLVGVLIMLFPQVFLIVAGIFFGTFFLSRYISLSSMCAAISLPLFYGLWLIIFKDYHFFEAIIDRPLMQFAILIAIFVPLTHIKNIKRLIRGEEPKFVFKKHSTHDQPQA